MGDATIDDICNNLRPGADPSNLSNSLAQLEGLPDEELHKALHDTAATSSSKLKVISAVLLGCDMCAPCNQVLKRRKNCFEAAISLLKCSDLSSQQDTRELIEVLGGHARHLGSDDVLALVDSILDGRNIGGANSLAHLLELLPILINDSAECREYAVEKLYDMCWPADKALSYTSSLVELSRTEMECERAMGKILSYLVQRQHPEERGPSTARRLDPEELPSLVYHLTMLSKKCSSSNSLASSLLDVISESLDCLIESVLGPSESTGAASTGVRRMRPLLATIMHLLTVMLTKDQVSTKSTA